MGSAQRNHLSEFISQLKVSSILTDGIMFLSGVLVTLCILWSFPSILISHTNSVSISSSSFINTPSTTINPEHNQTSFYEDKEVSYLMEKPVKNWDQKRQQWLASHQSFLSGSVERVLIVTGSQPKPCQNPIGDHLQLRLFKNKVDYCRIHGCDVFFNNVLLHPKMFHFWAKYPVVKAAMIAHPEVEWIWWIDVDAVITDMDFDLPLEKYKAYNLIAYGWPEAIVNFKTSLAINAGVFMIRNCQWSMDLLDRWVDFGPQSPNYEKWGKIQQETFIDKEVPVSDDQAALSFLILKEKEIWGDKIYLEHDYYFQGYWEEIVGMFENVTSHYTDIERKVPALRSRHAEKAGEDYRSKWKKYLDGANTGIYNKGSWRRPFVTHFTGCEPCGGNHNPMYTAHQCWQGIMRSLNFADNQVLRNFGYTRRDLNNSSLVEPLSFD